MRFYSNGKLLLSGEYLVLQGAKALALPLKFGQDLNIETKKSNKEIIYWKSYQNELLWFECILSLPRFKIIEASDQIIAEKLSALLKLAHQHNPGFIKSDHSYFATSTLNFNRNWGLGSSSSLVSNISEWSGADPYFLLKNSFGGSGYDIACASARQSIFYQLAEEKPMVGNADFNPSFKDHLYFVYLGKKQKSVDSIKEFEQKTKNHSSVIAEISKISETMTRVQNVSDFQDLMLEHEKIIAGILDRKRIKEERFPDFKGEIKSLGGWGGDFVMAASEMGEAKIKSYFESKGLNVIFKFEEMALGY